MSSLGMTGHSACHELCTCSMHVIFTLIEVHCSRCIVGEKLAVVILRYVYAAKKRGSPTLVKFVAHWCECNSTALWEANKKEGDLALNVAYRCVGSLGVVQILAEYAKNALQRPAPCSGWISGCGVARVAVIVGRRKQPYRLGQSGWIGTYFSTYFVRGTVSPTIASMKKQSANRHVVCQRLCLYWSC